MLWRRHHGGSGDALPESWHDVVTTRMALWAQLDDDEQASVQETARWLLGSKHWEAARGFSLTDEVRVLIAAQAALLVLGLGQDQYRIVSAIIVHPTTVTTTGERAGPTAGTVSDDPMPILGQASDERGPILIAWDAVLQGSAHPEWGSNVVHHEFAHKLDMLDGYADGVPPLGDRELAERWVAVCRAELDVVRDGTDRHPVLRPYAGVNEAEFFAVASEAFLNVPLALEAHNRELYDLLATYYGQDPASRARRAGHHHTPAAS